MKSVTRATIESLVVENARRRLCRVKRIGGGILAGIGAQGYER